MWLYHTQEVHDSGHDGAVQTRSTTAPGCVDAEDDALQGGAGHVVDRYWEVAERSRGGQSMGDER